jgi:hypothetical protein
MLLGKVVMRLHLCQAACGAFKFESQFFAFVELVWRGSCGDYDLHITVIELIDGTDKSACDVIILTHYRYI